MSDTLVGWRTWASMPGHVRVVAYVKKSIWRIAVLCQHIRGALRVTKCDARGVGGGYRWRWDDWHV